MQITSVSYSRLISTGNFENEKVGAVADVEEGGDPVIALAELNAWVNREIVDREAIRDHQQQRSELTFELRDLQEKIAAATERWERMRAFLMKHGLELPTAFNRGVVMDGC